MLLPVVLTDRLERELRRFPAGAAQAAVERLIAQYRSGSTPDHLIIGGEVEAAVYAAYRMPATYAAASAAMAATAAAEPGLAPTRLLDVGGGTGAALWAAARIWPSLQEAEVIDGAGPALRLGEQLAEEADAAVVRSATWRGARLPGELAVGPDDLVTVSYVLGELVGADRNALVEQVCNAGTVLLVEPGTPAGYTRLMAARAQLIQAGLRVVAPCPVQTACPLPAGDWCHFAARVSRSALHRRLKSADLGHEDEKYSYVAATRLPAAALPPASRVLRHPSQRKGLVTLQLCTPDGLATRLISKSQGDTYRQARRTAWGDSFPG
jgi:ribosomal protein RSM22 (predicted rRNA methylase)